MKPKVLLEREGYRFIEAGILEINGKPDYRMQKQMSTLNAGMTFIFLIMFFNVLLQWKILNMRSG